MRRRDMLILAGLTIAGAALRFYRIGAQSLWFDELLSLTIGRLPLAAVVTSPASIDPPLYYVMLHLWLALGRHDGIIRALSAIAGVATIPAICVLGRHLFDVRVGLTAAGIFALAPLQVFFAQEARMYTWLVWLSTLSLWTYSRAQGSTRARDWVCWAVVTTLGLYVHNFMVMLLAALDLDALLRTRTRRSPLVPVVLANLAIGLACSPWLLLMPAKLRWLEPALWLERPGLVQPLLTLYHFIFSYMVPARLFALGVALVLEMLGVTLMAARRPWARNADAMRMLLLSTFVPLVVTWLVAQWRPIYLDRLLLESAPSLYVLLAWGLVASARRKLVRLGALVAVPLALLSLANYYADPEYGKPRLREVIEYVTVRRAGDELVVHTSDSSFLAGLEYDGAGRHLLLYNAADQWLTPALMRELRVPFATEAPGLAADGETFWLVVALDHITSEQLDEKGNFDQRARVLEKNQIGGIGIYHYAARSRPPAGTTR